MLPKCNILTKLSHFFFIPETEILLLIEKYKHRYKAYKIPKASGGTRTIYHPCRQLKALQHAVQITLLNNLPISDLAHAYVHGLKSPLLVSASKHSNYRYTIRIDFTDFFPSICPDDLFNQLNKYCDYSATDCNMLQQILFFFKQNKYLLPIGAPSSPVISNIVMRDLDSELVRHAFLIDPGSGISRYADDVYFSTNTKGLCKKFFETVERILANTASPKLSINNQKTLFLSKGTKRLVNGLYITPNGNISVGKSRKTAIKSLIYKYSKRQLTVEEIKKAQGLLAFIQDCEPDYYNKLALKYSTAFFLLKNDK